MRAGVRSPRPSPARIRMCVYAHAYAPARDRRHGLWRGRRWRARQSRPPRCHSQEQVTVSDAVMRQLVRPAMRRRSLASAGCCAPPGRTLRRLAASCASPRRSSSTSWAARTSTSGPTPADAAGSGSATSSPSGAAAPGLGPRRRRREAVDPLERDEPPNRDDFASFDDLPGRPVAREPEQDKLQRALAREVEAARSPTPNTIAPSPRSSGRTASTSPTRSATRPRSSPRT